MFSLMQVVLYKRLALKVVTSRYQISVIKSDSFVVNSNPHCYEKNTNDLPRGCLHS